MEQLFDDFARFSKLHSWYKHNSLEGTSFYMYQTQGQQPRNGIDGEVEDASGLHWHFTRSRPLGIQRPVYSVQLGPFLRGLEGHNNKIAWGLWIIYDRNRDVFQRWITQNYPEWVTEDWETLKEEIDHPIVHALFQKEHERYWRAVCEAIGSDI